MTVTDALIRIFSLVLVVAIVGFVFSFPAMLLWNSCLVPAVPALQPVTWLQMYGISILFSIILPKASYTEKKA